VYRWLNLIWSKNQAGTLAFVIMPNHVHLLLQLCSETVNRNLMIGNGKRFMAYEIVKRLTENNKYAVLNELHHACSAQEIAKGQKHKVFEPSFDAKPVFTEKFLYQKLDYIHHNPVSGKWRLSTDFVEYRHSSAAFYETGNMHSKVLIQDFRK